MSINKVVALKIHRNNAGRVIPYDKIYFFHRDNRNLIPKCFEYALVLPISEDLIAQIKEGVPKEVSEHHFMRDDDVLNMSTSVDRRSITKEALYKWWDVNFFKEYALEECVAVVPILLKKQRKKALPRYLVSRRWSRRMRSPYLLQPSTVPGIHELAYLATPLPAPHDKVQPICNMCPRQLLQLNGECTPGEPVCYRSLNFNEILTEEEQQEIDANARL